MMINPQVTVDNFSKAVLVDGVPAVSFGYHVQDNSILPFRLKSNYNHKIGIPIYPFFSGHVKLDEEGFREHKTFNGDPILIFGDSVAFGSGVDNNETFSCFLEDLAGSPVKNFGIPGAGPAMYSALYSKYADKYQKHVALFFWYSGNDFLNLANSEWDGLNDCVGPREKIIRRDTFGYLTFPVWMNYPVIRSSHLVMFIYSLFNSGINPGDMPPESLASLVGYVNNEFKQAYWPDNTEDHEEIILLLAKFEKTVKTKEEKELIRDLLQYLKLGNTPPLKKIVQAQKMIKNYKLMEFEEYPNKVLRLHILLGKAIRNIKPVQQNWGYTLTFEKILGYLPSEPVLNPLKEELAFNLKEKNRKTINLLNKWFPKWRSFKNRISPPKQPPEGCSKLQIIVDQIKDTANKGNNNIVFFLLPNENSLISEKNPFASKNSFLIKQLDSKGIKVVDLFGPFRKHYLSGGDGQFIDESGHLNVKGHRFVAELVDSEIHDLDKKVKYSERNVR